MQAEPIFPVELGGRRWELPRLPFGIVRRIQPRLLRHSSSLVGDDEAALVGKLDEAALLEQAEIVALTLRAVDPEVTIETLDGMVIGAGELASALVQCMRACGLETAGAEDVAGTAIAAAPA